MCGRYTHLLSWAELRDLMSLTTDLSVPLLERLPRFNISPTQQVPVIRLNDDGKRELVMMRWGLIPFWAKEAKIGYSSFNARGETLATKPAFRDAFKKRRCLIPSTGFYEWEKSGKAKLPWHIVVRSRECYAMAGIWDRWTDTTTGEIIESCSIVTCESNDVVRPLHDRMPVILMPGEIDTWLQPDAKPGELQALIAPLRAEFMERYRVSPDVNSSRNDEKRFVEPV